MINQVDVYFFELQSKAYNISRYVFRSYFQKGQIDVQNSAER